MAQHGESLAAPPEQFKEEVVQVEGRAVGHMCGRVRGQPEIS